MGQRSVFLARIRSYRKGSPHGPVSKEELNKEERPTEKRVTAGKERGKKNLTRKGRSETKKLGPRGRQPCAGQSFLEGGIWGEKGGLVGSVKPKISRNSQQHPGEERWVNSKKGK